MFAYLFFFPQPWRDTVLSLQMCLQTDKPKSDQFIFLPPVTSYQWLPAAMSLPQCMSMSGLFALFLTHIPLSVCLYLATSYTASSAGDVLSIVFIGVLGERKSLWNMMCFKLQRALVTELSQLLRWEAHFSLLPRLKPHSEYNKAFLFLPSKCEIIVELH